MSISWDLLIITGYIVETENTQELELYTEVCGIVCSGRNLLADLIPFYWQHRLPNLWLAKTSSDLAFQGDAVLTVTPTYTASHLGVFVEW